MSKPVILTVNGWATLYKQIQQDHPKSVWMISRRMKEKLGFTVRQHVDLPKDGQHWKYSDRVSIRLDFYDEPKRTMFLIKYGEFLKQSIED